MTTYFVTFCYTVEVEADDQEQAAEKGDDSFREQLLSGLGAGDFAMDEPQEIWWRDKEGA